MQDIYKYHIFPVFSRNWFIYNFYWFIYNILKLNITYFCNKEKISIKIKNRFHVFRATCRWNLLSGKGKWKNTLGQINFNNHERRSVTAFFRGTTALNRDSDEKRLQTVSCASRSHFGADFPDSRILPLSWEQPHATPHASMRDKTVSPSPGR